MGIIKVKNIGSFKRTDIFFEKIKALDKSGILDSIAQETIEELRIASPKTDKQGNTLNIASSWSYEIVRSKKNISILFNNSYVQNGVNIALIVNEGHISKSGNWIAGQHYIDGPLDNACKKIMKHISEGLK